MDVRCPQCETLYEFDESQLDSGSATLKCRKCQHMFRLGEDSQPSREDERRWMARGPDDGEILYFGGFDTLHEWIVDGEVDQRWAISRTGDDWTRLGEVGEFQSIFQAVDNVSNIEGESAVSRSEESEAEPEPEPPDDNGRDRQSTLSQFQQGGGVGPQAESPDEPTQRARPTAGDSSPSAESSSPTDRSRQDSDISVPNDSVEGREGEGPDRQSGRRQRTQSPARQATSPGAAAPSDSADPGGTEQPPRGSEPERSPPGSPQPSAESSGSRPTESSQSDVQLDSGRFGSQSTGGEAEQRDAQSEDWAFGDDPVEFEETTQVSDDEVTYRGGGRSWTTVLLVALLLAIGGAGYLWTYERQRVRNWVKRITGGAAEAADESPTEPKKPKPKGPSPAVEAAKLDLVEALGAATGAAETSGAKLFEGARSEAGTALADALAAAREKAEEADDESGGSGGGSLLGLLQDANEALERGDPARAESLYDQVLDREPDNSSALTGTGWAKLSQGEVSGARRQFKRALEVNPSFGDAYIGLGHANRKLGNLEEALENYKTYLDKFPGGSKESIAKYQRDQLEKKLGVN